MNNCHPITIHRAEELWNSASPKINWKTLYSAEVSSILSAMQAAYDAGRADTHEPPTTNTVEIIREPDSSLLKYVNVRINGYPVVVDEFTIIHPNDYDEPYSISLTITPSRLVFTDKTKDILL